MATAPADGATPDARLPPGRTPMPRGPGHTVVGVVGSIVAPTTLVTSLLFYFGMLHAYWFFAYFGVNYTVLGLSAEDFLLRSQDGLFVPLIVAAVVGLSGLWSYRIALHRLPVQVRRAVRAWLGPASATAGVAAVAVAVVGFVAPAALSGLPGTPGLSLALGVLLLAVASWTYRPRSDDGAAVPVPPAVAVGEWAACFVLVAVGLFWAAGDYSSAVGTGRGRQVEAGLAGRPDVVLFSEKSLNLRAAGVTERACTASDAAFGFRYDGLKLVQQAGDRYVFLPGTWSSTDGAAVVLPRDDALRLEFNRAGSARDGTC